MRQPYAKLMAVMWEEGSEFRRLPALAQRTYMVLISQPNISNCGVLPCSPKRWAKMACDTTVADLEAALSALVDTSYIVIDDETDELWVRSWMKYDGLINIHNGAKGVARSISAVLSATLRNRVIRTALTLAPQGQRTHFEDPSQDPSEGSSQDPYEDPYEDPSQDPSEGRSNGLGKSLTNGLRKSLTNYNDSSSNNNDNSEQQQQRNPDGSDPVDNPAVAAAAAARFLEAMDEALELRRQTTDVRNNTSWERTTRAGQLTDYGDTIRQLLTDPECTPDRAARIALGVEQPHTPPGQQAWHADPHCTVCPGDGWVKNHEDRLVRCACWRPDPYLAAVRHLRGAS